MSSLSPTEREQKVLQKIGSLLSAVPRFADEDAFAAFVDAFEQVENYPWDEEQKGLVYEMILRTWVYAKELGHGYGIAAAESLNDQLLTLSEARERE